MFNSCGGSVLANIDFFNDICFLGRINGLKQSWLISRLFFKKVGLVELEDFLKVLYDGRVDNFA